MSKQHRRLYAGKLGPWARHPRGTRYLDIGRQGKPDYRRIVSVEKTETWHWIQLRVEGAEWMLLRWCNTNIYE